ncbi:hypothetical protein KI387_042345, partial [Taxus chinensis]
YAQNRFVEQALETFKQMQFGAGEDSFFEEMDHVVARMPCVNLIWLHPPPTMTSLMAAANS